MRHRYDAGKPGECRFTFEAPHSCGFSNDLGRTQGSAARQFQQGWRYLRDIVRNAFLEGLDVHTEAADIGKFGARELGNQTRLGMKPLTDACPILLRQKRPSLRVMVRIDLMDPPQQPIDGRLSLGDEIFSPVGEELQIARDAVYGGRR